MDFTSRNAQPQSFQPGTASPSPAPTPQATHTKKDKKQDKSELPKWYRLVTTGLLIVIVLLVLSLTGLVATSRPETQSKFVDTSKLQAVFLNSGQVYFGNIKSLNGQYYVLENIYYLQSGNNNNSEATAKDDNNNISLVKLGCELHQPYDRMIINHDEVTFWENLKSDGQVAKAVKQFNENNPNGQTCSTTTTTNTNNVQGSNPSQNTNSSANTNKKP